MCLDDERADTEKPYVSSEGSQVSGQGIAALVLGAFAVAVSFLPVLGLPALVLGPLAIILAVIARNRQPRDTVTATAGLILGITGTVVALIVTALVLVSYNEYRDALRGFPLAGTKTPAASEQAEADPCKDGNCPPTATAEPAPSAPTATAEPAPSAPVATAEPAPSTPAGTADPAPAAGHPAGDCLGSGAGTAGGQPVTFIVEGEPGKIFNVDYGTPAEKACAAGATGRWEATMPMLSPTGVGITAWSDSGKDQKLTCEIIMNGQVVSQSESQGDVGCFAE